MGIESQQSSLQLRGDAPDAFLQGLFSQELQGQLHTGDDIQSALFDDPRPVLFHQFITHMGQIVRSLSSSDDGVTAGPESFFLPGGNHFQFSHTI